jgi:hypothetical protein
VRSPLAAAGLRKYRPLIYGPSSWYDSPSVGPRFGLAHMDAYRLFIYSDDGQLIGPAKTIHAADDAEAIAQAEVVRGSLAAEVLDVEGLRIVKYLPGNGGAPPPQAAG